MHSFQGQECIYLAHFPLSPFPSPTFSPERKHKQKKQSNANETITMTEGGQLTSPLACFIAGALVPITYFYLTKSSKADGGGIPLGDDDDWDDSDDDDVQPTSGGNTSSSSWGLKDAPYKMVLCVNQELGMGKGTLRYI